MSARNDKPTFPARFVGGLVLGLAFVCASSASADFSIKAARFVEQLHASYPGDKPFCGVDFFVDDRGIVYRIGDHAAGTELRLGDRIVSLDGKAFTGVEAHRQLLVALPADAKPSYQVKRGDETRTVVVDCIDGRRDVDLWLRALEAGAARQWSDCVRLNEEFIAKGGPSAGAHMVSFMCETERTGGRASPSAVRYARAAASALIDESVHLTGGFDRNGRSILDLVGWLRQAGMADAADELTEKLAAAQKVSPAASK